MYGVVLAGWLTGVGVQILNPWGSILLWEALPTEWMEIILWVAYACLAYHGCDMFVWVCVHVWRGVFCVWDRSGSNNDREAKRGERHKGRPQKTTLIKGTHKFHIMRRRPVKMTSRQSYILSTWVHVRDKQGPSNGKDRLIWLRLPELRVTAWKWGSWHIKVHVWPPSHDWPSYGSSHNSA